MCVFIELHHYHRGIVWILFICYDCRIWAGHPPLSFYVTNQLHLWCSECIHVVQMDYQPVLKPPTRWARNFDFRVSTPLPWLLKFLPVLGFLQSFIFFLIFSVHEIDSFYRTCLVSKVTAFYLTWILVLLKSSFKHNYFLIHLNISITQGLTIFVACNHILLGYNFNQYCWCIETV